MAGVSVDGVSQNALVPHDSDVSMEAGGQGPSVGLRTNVASGVRWGIIVSIATQVGRIAFMLALMRLLGPRNFGIVGQAAVIIAVAQIFVHFGLATSIVQRPQLDHNEIGTAFWLNVAVGLVLAILVVFSAPILSAFFKTEELTTVLQVLSLSLILRSVALVPSALLTRNMQFRSLGIIEVAGTFISGIVGIGAAAVGAGYWALVIQTVSLEAICLLLVLYINGLPDLHWSAATARSLWSFSSRILGADLVNYVSGNLDKVVVAKFLGATALGLYSLAFRILQLTLSVCTQVGRVILPTLARLQGDRERLARAFLSITESVSLAVFPAMILTILIAPVAVPAVVGEAWADAVLPLQLISAMTIPWILISFMGPLTVAVGRADWEFYWSILNMLAMIVVIPIGLRWGIVGVATAYLIMLSILTPVRFAIIQRLIPISVRAYSRALAPASVSSLVLAAVWLLTDVLLQGKANQLLIILAASVTGGVAYMVAFKLVWPDDFRRELEFARLVLR
ncbi:lipopolysaccharide biosynthesis protein [Mesorhizobium sp. BAC0120]|uniref:lipopolysaccharide biosynthesis protein n=1 Tax=Mesorhizobium sp. BAC0120 TaxID=3090670 RepID=UPI00298C6FEB|nr:lipopolysaccharide biosynthesis protein [Mesorhizobium sp. BAC0120]MDW6021567.1 lipopolysaccharide biosynthesis protein [Mesorhizobium sp. BAC0120]